MSADSSSLVNVARDLLERADPMTVGIWPRATALLARQALEDSLDRYWRLRAPGVQHCSTRAQLLCLPAYLSRGEELAERVSYAWAGLSRACHQHPYELAPTASELAAWLVTVEEFERRVRSESPLKPTT